jgi:hypothetical protein
MFNSFPIPDIENSEKASSPIKMPEKSILQV